jgi:acetyl-CoA C-acetyltransferase/acetyl-CoA acyltransferase
VNSQRTPPPEPLAVIAGVRTPFAKAFGALQDCPADELGRTAAQGVIARSGLSPADIDEVVIGNVAGPPEASNVARVIALKAGIPWDRPAHTVNRNCASGMESLLSAWQIIREGRARIILAGGAESMSNVPLLWDARMRDWLLKLSRAKGWKKGALLAQLRPAFFKPIPGLELGLTDPVCGLNMGQTAEVLAKEFAISRAEQDAFALASHQRATAAWQRCFLKDEVVPIAARDGRGDAVEQDVGPRANQSLAALAKLRPMFDRQRGTVTAGNSCPLTDGAAATIVMSAEHAQSRNLKPLGYIRDYAIAGCDPSRMGLGPVFAIHKLLNKTGLSLDAFELVEINEAFAAQVLACLAALASADFARLALGGESGPIGVIDPERLNINGGAIALGHPVGSSGTRLIITLLRALREQGRRRGLASLCVGGGQGVAMWLETELTG